MKLLFLVFLLVAAACNPFTSNAQTGPGSALQFDGFNDYVSLAPLDNVTAPGLSNQMTIEVWIKPTNITARAFSSIIRQQANVGGASPDWLLSFQDFGTVLSFGLSAATEYSELDVPITASNFTDGNWHHIAAIYNAGEGTMRLYVDGFSVGLRNKSGFLVNGTNHLAALGSTYNGTGEFFEGQIDELRIWRVGRSLDQIRADRFRRLAGNEEGLEAYYRLDEGSSNATVDGTGHGHNGALQNGVAWVTSLAPVGALPTATTMAPTLGAANATLLATINPNGLTNYTWFEWRRLDINQFITTPVQTNIGNSNIVVSHLLSNLSVNYLMDFRVVSTNILGRAEGSTIGFRPVNVPTVTTLAPTPGGSNALFSARVNPNGLTNYTWFQWGLTTNYGDTTAVQTNNDAYGYSDITISELITNLVPDTVYNFRAVSSNSVGTNVGANISFVSITRPEVATLAASNITTTAASLNALASPNGGPTAVWFEWGLSANYGNLTAPQNFGAATNPFPVSQMLTGLIGSNTYHYRAAISNSAGISIGNDQSFATPAGAPSVATVLPLVGGTSATLRGQVAPNGLATQTLFEWGTDASLGITNFADSNGLPFTNVLNLESASLTNLTGSKTYFYRVSASNALGAASGNVMSFTTLPAPLVSTGFATNLNDARVLLNGQVNPNGDATVAWFEYGSTTNYGNLTSAQALGNGSNSAEFTKLETNFVATNSYHYRIAASNSFGVAYGTDRIFTVAGAPPLVLTVAALNVGSTTAMMTGAVNPNNLTTYSRFEFGTTTNYNGFFSFQPQGNGTNTLFVIENLALLIPGTTYHYRVIATNVAGISYGSDSTFTTLGGPPIVTTLMASPVTVNAATLRASVNPNLVSTLGWFEWGLNTNYGNVTPFQSLGSSNSPASISQSLTGLNGGTTYHFRVVANNFGGITYGADQTFTTATALPLVVTQPASGIGGFSASMNGLVFPNGASTRAWFEWGTNASLGQVVPLRAASAVSLESYQYITLPTINLTASSNLTLEAWIKPSSITTYPHSPIIRQQPANYAVPPDWLLSFQDGGETLSFGVHTSSKYQELDVAISPGYFTDGNWHHVAAVYTGTNQLLYIDHSLAGSNNLSGQLAFSGATHAIGADTSEEYFLRGAIDDVRIWSSALDVATLETWMDKPVDNSHPAYASLEGNWNFEEPSTVFAYDSSTRGRDGEIVGEPLRVPGIAGSTFFTQPSQFNSLLTGLNQSTTYYYRLVGSNSLGVINGAITNFTTTPVLFISSASFTTPGHQQFQIGFNTQSNQTFSVLSSTNFQTWTNLGSAIEASPGQYQFIDSNAFLHPRRFYQLQSP